MNLLSADGVYSSTRCTQGEDIMVTKAERLQKQLEVSTARAKEAREALAELRRVQNHKAQKEARKKRNHALFESAGLLILAGLVDSKTGIPSEDRGALLGGLLVVAKTLENGTVSERFQEWKKAGDARLAEQETIRKSSTATTPTSRPAETTSEALITRLSDHAISD